MIQLEGFEVALADKIAADYQFEDESLSSDNFGNGKGRPVINRHIFVQDLVEVEDIKREFSGFDELTEPTFVLFTESSRGLRPSGSRGGLHEWIIRIAIRHGSTPEIAKGLLENLVEWIKRTPLGVVGRFVVKGRELQTRPRLFAREGDDHVYADAIFQFLVVALPT
jgi:hypothetical protein